MAVSVVIPTGLCLQKGVTLRNGAPFGWFGVGKTGHQPWVPVRETLLASQSFRHDKAPMSEIEPLRKAFGRHSPGFSAIFSHFHYRNSGRELVVLDFGGDLNSLLGVDGTFSLKHQTTNTNHQFGLGRNRTKEQCSPVSSHAVHGKAKAEAWLSFSIALDGWLPSRNVPHTPSRVANEALKIWIWTECGSIHTGHV